MNILPGSFRYCMCTECGSKNLINRVLCSECKIVFYCSEDCRKKHLAAHIRFCHERCNKKFLEDPKTIIKQKEVAPLIVSPKVIPKTEIFENGENTYTKSNNKIHYDSEEIKSNDESEIEYISPGETKLNEKKSPNGVISIKNNSEAIELDSDSSDGVNTFENNIFLKEEIKDTKLLEISDEESDQDKIEEKISSSNQEGEGSPTRQIDLGSEEEREISSNYELSYEEDELKESLFSESEVGQQPKRMEEVSPKKNPNDSDYDLSSSEEEPSKKRANIVSSESESSEDINIKKRKIEKEELNSEGEEMKNVGITENRNIFLSEDEQTESMVLSSQYMEDVQPNLRDFSEEPTSKKEDLELGDGSQENVDNFGEEKDSLSTTEVHIEEFPQSMA